MSGFKRKQQILKQAMATPPADLHLFLDQACGEDEPLRKEIEMKIAEHQGKTGPGSSGEKDQMPRRAKNDLIPSRLKQALKHTFELQERLSGGGMCDLFLATHKSLGGKWIVKVLSERLAKDPKIVDRFIMEAKIEANLQHPNIVKVFNIGDAGGYHYFVMEYIEGHDLSSLITGQPLSEAKASAIAVQICNALECAHDHNIVHRDLKPSNVRIDKYGSVYVLDFGIARACDMAMSSTAQNETLGTPLYMSPEQIRGTDIDSRSDLYSLGILLYEMLTGRNPFEADSTHAVYSKHLSYNPDPLRQVNPLVSMAMSNLVLRLMEKDPDKRFNSVTEVADLLKPLGTPAAPKPEKSESVEQMGQERPDLPAAPPKESTPPPQISGPRRLKLESSGGRRTAHKATPEPGHMPTSDRVIPADGKSNAFVAAIREALTRENLERLAKCVKDYVQIHKRGVIANAALLIVVVTILIIALQPSSVTGAVAGIDAVPFADIAVIDSKGTVVKTGITPAVFQLSPGQYTVRFEHEGSMRSVPLQIEPGKSARIREDFWKEQLNSKIEALLDNYIGEIQIPIRPK
jgi:serine/threonine protein kinase